MPARSFLNNNAFSAASKLRTPNMYCWSRKTLVAIHWTHLRVNLICIKSFCPQKRITACCSLQDDFNGNIAIFNVYKWRHSDVIVIKLTAGRHSDVIVIKLTAGTQNTELNSLKNVYFGLFIFGKLTKWRCFVTYLSHDPRIIVDDVIIIIVNNKSTNHSNTVTVKIAAWTL